ncbi:MAG TPA: response regulator, partial [Anaerolineae bacterium]|nr:response regulator [Anaerolineae bacterium]
GADWQGTGSILVIDDELDVRIVTTRMLERFGFSVLTADDGRTGVEVFRTHADSIVCVLLDMMMPQLDGQETLRLIRQIKPDARVILMSGYNDQEAIRRFAGKGIAAFLPKPFTANDLRTKLQPLFNASGGY